MGRMNDGVRWGWLPLLLLLGGCVTAPPPVSCESMEPMRAALEKCQMKLQVLQERTDRLETEYGRLRVAFIDLRQRTTGSGVTEPEDIVVQPIPLESPIEIVAPGPERVGSPVPGQEL